jgi:hypothetical protein
LENKKGWCIFTPSLTLKHTTMKNQIQIAEAAAEKLNALYKEEIFSLRYGSTEQSAAIINDKYRYEGNDVDITFDEDGITGTVTSSTVKFSSVDELLEEIDQLFINEE